MSRVEYSFALQFLEFKRENYVSATFYNQFSVRPSVRSFLLLCSCFCLWNFSALTMMNALTFSHTKTNEFENLLAKSLFSFNWTHKSFLALNFLSLVEWHTLVRRYCSNEQRNTHRKSIDELIHEVKWQTKFWTKKNYYRN